MEEFSDKEKALLKPFVSNFDKDVFVLRNLPEVVKGALFSKYSRSSKSLRRVLLDDFILSKELDFEDLVKSLPREGVSEVVATGKAEKFYDRVLVGYGDDSVAELAGAHIALENISIVATKILEDARIGLSPLEKSTRYVYFDKKVDGKWRYYREPALMESEFAEVYVTSCDHSFETYAKLIPKVSEYVQERMPMEEGLSERAYEATVRAKTCDILRGLLPASTLTNMGFFGNGRGFEYLITKLYADELAEMRGLGSSMENELKTIIPSFVKRASGKFGKMMGDYLSGVRKDMEETTKGLSDSRKYEEVVLVDYDPDAYYKVVAASLYPYTKMTLEELENYAKNLSEEDKKKIVRKYVGERKNRRHKPGRGFERVYYTFEICANFGCYRDIHRHRVLTQQRELLNTNLGYRLPKDIVDAGYEKEFRDSMEVAKNAYEEISKKYPKQAQYVVPLAYNLRWQMTMNLREIYHFCELRSIQQGHPDYRSVAQKMYQKVREVHPLLADGMEFVDMKDYKFERLEAEKRIDKKMQEIKKKYEE
jgi:thymidylate synthase ThyX